MKALREEWISDYQSPAVGLLGTTGPLTPVSATTRNCIHVPSPATVPVITLSSMKEHAHVCKQQVDIF